MRAARGLTLVVAALAAWPGAARAADLPIQDGPTGRALLSDGWEFRASRTAPWRPVSIPHAFNANDDSAASFRGRDVEYRVRLHLPDAPAGTSFRLRFEGVSHRATVLVDGRIAGRHYGAYLPFEVDLPREGRDHEVVVRVSNRLGGFDLPPNNGHAGWWPHGGITREVYLRTVYGLDFDEVSVRPILACATCPALVRVRVRVRNADEVAREVRIIGRYGEHWIVFKPLTIPPRSSRGAVTAVAVTKPRLWSLTDPQLYDVWLRARAEDGASAGYDLHSGIRSVRVSPDGRLLLNDAPLNFRGVGLHEDHATRGSALLPADREQLVGWARELGATLLRTHYPLHPAFQELADRHGLLVWSEIPMFRMSTRGVAAARRRAIAMLLEDIRANRNHASVLLWSVGNEFLVRRPTSVERGYVAAAARAARAADPSRPIAWGIEGVRTEACKEPWASVDVLGVSDYFGWYRYQIDKRSDAGPYFDRMRACHPRQALVVKEFGAEANREGPATEKGTYAFQRDFIRYHARMIARRPYLSGATYWALQDFRIRLDWGGGNPQARPPMHEKGVVSRAGERKAAFFDLREAFRGATQLGPPK